MMTAERVAASARARRSYQLLTEHQAPTRQDLGEARDRLNECHNLSTSEQVWEAVNQLEATVAKTYGVPDNDQARTEGMTHTQRGTENRPHGQTIEVGREAPTHPTQSI